MLPSASVRPPCSGILIKGRYRRWALKHILAAEINCCMPALYTHIAAHEHMPTFEFICAGVHIPALVYAYKNVCTHTYTRAWKHHASTNLPKYTPTQRHTNRCVNKLWCTSNTCAEPYMNTQV